MAQEKKIKIPLTCMLLPLTGWAIFFGYYIYYIKTNEPNEFTVLVLPVTIFLASVPISILFVLSLILGINYTSENGSNPLCQAGIFLSAAFLIPFGIGVLFFGIPVLFG